MSRNVPGSRFPKRRFLRARDEAPAFMENLDFTPDIYFFDAAEVGLRYLAAELRKRGVLIYFEPESGRGERYSEIQSRKSERLVVCRSIC